MLGEKPLFHRLHMVEKNLSSTDCTWNTLRLQSQICGSQVPKLGLSKILEITPITHLLNI